MPALRFITIIVAIQAASTMTHGAMLTRLGEIEALHTFLDLTGYRDCPPEIRLFADLHRGESRQRLIAAPVPRTGERPELSSFAVVAYWSVNHADEAESVEATDRLLNATMHLGRSARGEWYDPRSYAVEWSPFAVGIDLHDADKAWLLPPHLIPNTGNTKFHY